MPPIALTCRYIPNLSPFLFRSIKGRLLIILPQHEGMYSIDYICLTFHVRPMMYDTIAHVRHSVRLPYRARNHLHPGPSIPSIKLSHLSTFYILLLYLISIGYNQNNLQDDLENMFRCSGCFACN